MGALMRAHDWRASALGPPDTWPQSLKSVVAMMTHSAFPMFIAWGEGLPYLYNDACIPIVGDRHPGALGRPFRDVWPDVWGDLEPLLSRALAGETVLLDSLPLTLERDGRPAVATFTFSYSPLHDEAGVIRGVLSVAIETTDSVRAARLADFRSDLAACTRDLGDPVEVMAAAAGFLGRRLGVSRCGYGEMDETGDFTTIEREWTDGALPRLVGRWRLDDFGPAVGADLRAGRTVRITDALADDRLDKEAASARIALGARATLNLPLFREGRLAALLYANQGTARHWTDEDEAFVREVAERTWSEVERARSAATLRESDARLRQVVEGMGEGFCVLDADFRVIEMNAEGMRLDGRSPAGIIGRSHWEAFPGSEDAEVGELYKKAMREGVPVALEHEWTYEDGRRAWYEMRAYPSADRLAIFFRDVTDRKRSEEALRIRGEEFQTLADNIPALCWMAYADGHIFWYNRRWYDYTGTSAEDQAGWGWESVHDPEILPGVVARWRRSLETGDPFEMTFPLKGADGVFRPFLTRINPIRDDAGEIVRWFGANTDVTELRAAELALRESEERLQQAKDAAGFGIYDFDLATGVIAWDPIVRGLWGVDADTPITFGLFIRGLHPDDRETTRALIERALDPAGDGDYRAQYRLGSADGPVRWVEAVGKILFDGGRPMRFVGTVKDISERKKAEEHRELLANELNHRVKNTLAMVQSLAGQTFRGDKTDASARQSFASRLQALAKAHDVLTRENWDRASLTDIVNETLAPHRGLSDSGMARISVLGPAVRLPAWMALNFSLALHELATNAAKYGSLSVDGGTVSIAWEVVETDPDRRLRFSWTERGGPSVRPPERFGFGTRLIERVLGADDATQVDLAFDPEGVTCRIDTPLP